MLLESVSESDEFDDFNDELSPAPSTPEAQATTVPAGHERGTVKFFNAGRGYGFINRAGKGDELFVHYSNIAAEGFKTLPEGADVTFRVGDGRKGPEAFDVALA